MEDASTPNNVSEKISSKHVSILVLSCSSLMDNDGFDDAVDFTRLLILNSSLTFLEGLREASGLSSWFREDLILSHETLREWHRQTFVIDEQGIFESSESK